VLKIRARRLEVILLDLISDCLMEIVNHLHEQGAAAIHFYVNNKKHY
jgi:hypothetical protein